MSWITRLNQELQIETGDSQRFTVSWKPSVIDQDFNISFFDFPNVSGTYVKRGEPKGRVFGIEFYFQGENHIEEADTFLRASADKRQWRILHPYYDELRVQPLRLRLDNKAYNTTKITGQIMETVRGGLPTRGNSFEEEIAARKLVIDGLTVSDFENEIKDIEPSEVNVISANIDSFESVGEKVINLEEEQISYRNKVLSAKSAVTNVINDANASGVKIQEVINFPSQVVASIKSRVNVLVNTYLDLINSIKNRSDISRNLKVHSYTMGATNVSALVLASITNMDYATATDVLDVVKSILNTYNLYIDDIDSLVTDNQTEEESFAPNPDVINALQELVNYATSNLLEIALESKQEYYVTINADSNVILLTHRIYGLDDNDENIDRFIQTNNIGLDKLFIIPKDTEVLYLV